MPTISSLMSRHWRFYEMQTEEGARPVIQLSSRSTSKAAKVKALRASIALMSPFLRQLRISSPARTRRLFQSSSLSSPWKRMHCWSLFLDLYWLHITLTKHSKFTKISNINSKFTQKKSRKILVYFRGFFSILESTSDRVFSLIQVYYEADSADFRQLTQNLGILTQKPCKSGLNSAVIQALFSNTYFR